MTSPTPPNTRLEELLAHSARRFPERTAIEDVERGVSITYRGLDELSDRIARFLADSGVQRGDRVGLCAPKSIGVVAAIFGALRAGAGYVPVDPTGPPQRGAGIMEDCGVRAAIVDASLAQAYRGFFGGSVGFSTIGLDGLAEVGAELTCLAAPQGVLAEGSDDATSAEGPQDISYILYTSGSTGRPKGVVHTHSSAISFVDWCARTFAPTEFDRFSSHAPFHFDLSILDLFVPIAHGATVVLMGESLGKAPHHLARTIAERRLTVWYSTPSILKLMLELGDLDSKDWSALRLVLFAGEVFPIQPLNRLRRAWPAPDFFNLYGPTETNVCTYFRLPESLDDRTEPVPIGRACDNDRTLVVDEDGREVHPGEEGELLVTGGSVMSSYWGVSDDSMFFVDPDGERWYRTGDLVQEDAEGQFAFRGRRDRMVKRSGYRVELGEIEASLYRHPETVETAVVAIPDASRGIVIKAFLRMEGGKRLSLVEMKRHCAEQLPLYMVPDSFLYLDAFPKTSTDKIDYASLARDS